VRVLAVGAHPDDLEILCGGTLARYVREGHAVTMCHATSGDRGSFTGTRAEVARTREAEARRAAEIAGADHVSLGLSDAEIDAADARQRRLVIDLVREARPDVIITHAPTDYMGDHNEISKLVFDCSFHATLPLLETDRPHHDTVTPIYYMDTLMGLDFLPTEFVDITDAIDTKVAMLEAHASQLTWLREHDGVDIVENMKTVAAYRGLQCSVAYAEAFRQCQTWLRATTRRYLPA
jgi:LmbE family N-acetylglucosaminyl deacetylase